MAARPVRVPPKGTVSVGATRVTNRTANSIEVIVRADGTVVVANCCLEEQGK